MPPPPTRDEIAAMGTVVDVSRLSVLTANNGLQIWIDVGVPISGNVTRRMNALTQASCGATDYKVVVLPKRFPNGPYAKVWGITIIGLPEQGGWRVGPGLPKIVVLAWQDPT